MANALNAEEGCTNSSTNCASADDIAALLRRGTLGVAGPLAERGKSSDARRQLRLAR